MEPKTLITTSSQETAKAIFKQEGRDTAQILEDIAREAWRIEPDIPAAQWIEENIVFGPASDMPGPVDFDIVPMSRFVIDSFQSRHVRRITMQVAAQCAKTKTAEFLLMWMLRNRPSHVAWYLDTQDKVKTFWKTRLESDFDNCDALDAIVPKSRLRRTAKLVQFSNMDLHLLSAGTSAARESITVSTVFLDEWRKYPPGAAQQIRNRFKSVSNWKEVGFSTAGNAGCELDRNLMEGSLHRWFWTCHGCGHAQMFRFGRDKTTLDPLPRECGGFVWESNATTKPGENAYDWKALAETVRYECENPKCRRRYSDSEKFGLFKTLKPVQTNPMAPPDHISCHWWEAYMPWAECSWPEIVRKFLTANVARKTGDFAPLEVFVKETLGESWETPGGEEIERGDLDACLGSHAVGEFRPIAQSDNLREIRIITVDMQQGYMFYILRQIVIDTEARAIESRQIQVGSLLHFDDLRIYQQSRDVENCWVFIDAAYKPDDVKRECRKHGAWSGARNTPVWNGWNPVRGHKAESFSVSYGGTRLKQDWRMDIEKTNQGHEIPIFSFSKDTYRRRLFLTTIRARAAEIKNAGDADEMPPHWWTVATDAPDDYFEQMQNVKRVPILDGAGQIAGHEWKETGRHDYPDCEQMQIAALDIGGVWDLIR